jgi:hypothetical protein
MNLCPLQFGGTEVSWPAQLFERNAVVVGGDSTTGRMPFVEGPVSVTQRANS